MDYGDKKRIFQQYIEALEEERQKMQVFHRELPLSLHLVSQAIESYRQQMTAESLVCRRRSDCEEILSDGQPVLEEFMPLKHGSSSSEKEEDEDDDDDEEEEEEEENERPGKKSDWLRSVQLWNQEPEQPTSNVRESSRKPEPVKKVGGAFHPFNGDKKTSKAPAAAAAASSTFETDSGGYRREEKEGRKTRRCWSPELHRRFLEALQQLGGSQVATPKQIKELMKVDGLTNDEVKSHLQKYRLHTRRPTAPAAAAAPAPGSNSNTTSITSTQPPHQFLVVGGIWVPPPEYPKTTKAMDQTTRPPPVYAPVATLPRQILPTQALQEEKQTHRSLTSVPRQWKGGRRRGSPEEDRANSSSPTTSLCSHTTTTSPAF